MHPNAFGHQKTTSALTRWLNVEAILAGPHPEPEPAATTELLGADRSSLCGRAIHARAVEGRDRAPGCDFGQLVSFATRVAVFDEQPSAGDEQPFRVPVAGADPDATICVTDAQGNWVALTPAVGGDDMNMASEQPTASIQDGRVFVTGGRPAPGCPTADQDDGVCAFQWILFRHRSKRSRMARHRHRTTRANGPGHSAPCGTARPTQTARARSQGGREAQITQAARKVAPPAALIFLGGWLLALGWSVLERKPVPGWLRRWGRQRWTALPTWARLGRCRRDDDADAATADAPTMHRP